MIYASKTPRDLNHDPKPCVIYLNHHRSEERIAAWEAELLDGVTVDGEEWQTVFDPRPEFDHVQHNEPNPILVEFRKARAAKNGVATASEWVHAYDAYGVFGGYKHWELPGHPFLSIINAQDDERDHAVRVLTRLSRFEQGA